MIDFRYHLVSLVAVFIALAVGIVLGAGPLRDSIGDTLSSQVDLLRHDREDLQQQVDSLDAQVAQRDGFVSALEPALVAGALSGESAVLVALPGADDDLVDEERQTLATAGADVTGTVSLQAAWSDPRRTDARRTVAAALPPDAHADLESTVTKDDADGGAAGAGAALAAALAAAVTTTEPVAAGEPSTAGPAVLEALASGDLLTLDGQPVQQATLAVVVAPAPADAPGADDETWTDAGTAAAVAVVSALARTAGAVVVAGPLAAATDDGVLAAVRSADAATRVSTVDAADTPAGGVTTVLALRAGLDGSVGQYGAGPGAQAVLPTSAFPGLFGPARPTPSSEATSGPGDGGDG